MVKICPICKKSFGGKAALAQHTASAHAPKVTPKAPAKKSRRNRSGAGGTTSNGTSGKDVLLTCSVKNGAKAGDILALRNIGAQSFTGTRLSAVSGLWARWRPQSMRLGVMAAGASTCYGAVMVGWVADPTYSVNKGVGAVNVVGAMKPHCVVKLNGTGSIAIPTTMSRTWYQTSGEAEDTSHGTLVVVAASDCGGWTGSLSVVLDLSWTVQFDGPEIPFTNIPSGGKIHPDSGWYDIFTTSDGSWDSQRLTFKMHSGGNMVPFSGAQPGLVYGPVSGSLVYYKKEDGTEAYVKYFSLVKGYSTPGLVCHATYADAVAYQDSGDNSKVLAYNGASRVATPSVPQFEVVTKLTCDEVFDDDDSGSVFQPSMGNGSTVSERLDNLESKIEEILSLFRGRGTGAPNANAGERSGRTVSDASFVRPDEDDL